MSRVLVVATGISRESMSFKQSRHASGFRARGALYGETKTVAAREVSCSMVALDLALELPTIVRWQALGLTRENQPVVYIERNCA